MEYFIISQDETYTGAIRPLGAAKLVPGFGLITENWAELNEQSEQLYLDEDGGDDYVDLIVQPVPLVSDSLKQLLQRFDPALFFKPVVLANPKAMRQDLYWLMNLPGCACCAPQSEFHQNGSLKRLVIEREKAAGKWIFKVTGIAERLIVINLGVAEAMLRREFDGFKLSRIESI